MTSPKCFRVDFRLSLPHLCTLLLFSMLWCVLAVANEPAAGQTPKIIQLGLEGPIGPASSDYVTRALDYADETKASLVIIRLDTPGGLDTAMREIIKKIIASPVPVATYVAPGGARAASAGVYILYASHIAAMAPATNLGAATPVQIGLPGGFDEDKPQTNGKTKSESNPDHVSVMDRKMTNDAVAYIRGLATLRGRNADWAEKTVRDSVSLPAEEALKLKVIDLVAADVNDLLRQVEGRSVNVSGQPVKLNFAGARIEPHEPDWRNRLLAGIANPNVAYILMLIGIYGLILEFYQPGTVAPGTIGAICLLLGLYALQALSVNYAGLALILLGIGLMIAEAFAPSFGILGIGGIVAFVFGSVILMDTDIAGDGLSMGVIAAFAITSVILCIVTTRMLLKVRRKPVVTGREGLIGGFATAMEDFTLQGRVWIHGETWTAQTEHPLKKGQSVKVKGIEGLTLTVTPLQNETGE
ncbi:MAG: nodulation protein NfeD [Proteobacteria bacterium]|nr:nodulation protein NfeD [Pseudomonadota bacterium]